MAILTAQQRKLFDELHRSRLEDFKTFNKKSYRGIWNSVIEKYPETAHFIYELLQNADDAEATEVYIIVNKHEMIFKHNGKKHFDVTSEDAVPVGDINSITGIGDSSKIETQNKIGKFGVGFKAVFQYTDTPEIYDDYFKFKIENYIVPTLLPYDHPQRKEGETLFLFPFKDEVKAYNEIIRKLERLDNPILFLRNLQKIVWRIDRKKGFAGDELIYSKTLIDEEEYDDNTYLEKYLLQDGSGSRSIFLFSENIEITSENKTLPICVGFYYDEKEKKLITNTQQNIFCYFPTKETFKTCFISHGPFLLTDNRQNLKPDEQYNKQIINYIADLASRAVLYLRDYGIKHKHPLIDENLTEIIPEYKYSHSWYGNALDDLFESPIYYAFKEIVETEEIFLTRNNKYLKIEDAYIAAPRELEGLLNQKQLSSLIVYSEEDEDKRNADFMKWELSQKISKRDDDIFEDRNEFSSELFGSCISEDFMKEQDFRWVIRLYNFLRSAAPKLWKILDRDKNAPQSRLVFRSAPIIKTQKEEWVAPYLDNTTLNVYLPLKKDASSEYNFVSEEYLENKSAIRFFNELNIKEPDELDYIQSVILNKFRGTEFEIDNDDIRTDFDVIIAYYKNLLDHQKRQSFLELIKQKLYLVGADDVLHRPSEMYIKTPMLEEYFSEEDVVFVDLDFYDSAISKYGMDDVIDFVTLLGVDRYPAVLAEERGSKYFVSLPTRELIQTHNYSHYTIKDYALHGFSEAIGNIDEDLSLYIWNEVLPGINYEKYENLCLSYRRKYARTYEKAYYDSSFKCDLINAAWIYTNNGILLSPKDMFLEDLAPEYNRNNGLITFLGIQKRERPVIIEMGGTEEQQSSYDFGKSIKEEFGEDLSEDEIRMALLKARAEKKSRQRKESVQDVDSGQMEVSSQSSKQESDDESVESKLNKKWEKKAAEKITRPHSSPNSGSESPIDFNPTKQEEQPIQPFFENKPSPKYHDSTETDNDSVERKMKAREEEAKEKAEQTSELVQILELLNNEKKFSFKWYKLLMELMHANRSESMNRHVQIDFSEWSFICSDKLLHLTIPSKPVPQWVAEAENYVISSLGKEPKKIEGVIVKTDETSIDVSIEKNKDLEEICAKANSIRLSADNSSNFIDSLEKRFIQLGYEDDYDLNEHLTENIKFIYGPPGTGKTTRVVEIVNELLSSPSKKTNILVLTPTNKAADVVCTKMVDDDVCYNYLTRFGTTESLYLIEDAAVVCNREDTDMDLLDHNIVVTTAARYAYDYLQPDDTFICDFPWDYIIIDEASMIDILTVTYILYKGAASSIIISGDPKQIQPVSQNDMPTYNVYDLVGLHGFADALKRYKRYPVEALTIQHRSIPSIGRLVSKFAYDGIVQPDPDRLPQKPLKLDAIDINEVNFLGFDIKEFDNIYGLTAINGSAFHVYSAIFTYNMVGYVSNQIKKKYTNSHYTIGIVCPYKAEADAIRLMLENKPLDNECCSVTCGTVHSFQGDECDIMFVVLNPPARCSSNSHINNENILNVAMSRARDYLFFILPKNQVPGFTRKNDIGRLRDSQTSCILYCSDVEDAIWGYSNYIEANTHVTCHMPVNVYYERQAKYDVRIADDALDIKINETTPED